MRLTVWSFAKHETVDAFVIYRDDIAFAVAHFENELDGHTEDDVRDTLRELINTVHLGMEALRVINPTLPGLDDIED